MELRGMVQRLLDMNKKNTLIFTSLFLLLWVLTSCGEGDLEQTTISPATIPTALPLEPSNTPTTIEMEVKPTSTPAVPTLLPDDDDQLTPVKLAQVDLAQRLAVSPDRVQLKNVEEVTWPNSGLGCPEPGKIYAQMLTPGYRIQLEMEGDIYEYHSNEEKIVVFCEEEPMSEQLPAPGIIEPGMESLVQAAKTDLVQRLSIQADQIELLEAKLVVWRDSSLGCPQPGMNYLQVLRDGGLIRLWAGDREYRYHSGGNRPPFLCETPKEPYSG